jgi:NADH-quinone oxidoreductase subunit M
MYQLVSHGIISALLFLIAGSFYDRTKDRTIHNYEGLAKQVPQLTTAAAITFFAALGLPMFSGFIGEFFILLGSFHASSINGLIPRIFSILAVGGVFLGAFYFIWTFQRMFFGKPWMQAGETEIHKFYDLTIREKTMMYPLLIITFILGIFPHFLFNIFSTYLESFSKFQ